jgi:putative ABC transport system permease protein
MIQITRVLPWKRHQSLVPIFITLAFWRLRQSWRLLLVTWLGIVVAVMIACTLPTFSDVSLTAGLHAVLNATPEDSQIAVQTKISLLNALSSYNQTLYANLANELCCYHNIDSYLSYLSTYSQYLLQVPGFSLISDNPALDRFPVVFTSVPIQQAAPHLHLLQGQLPQPISDNVEAVITDKTAKSMHATIGSTITLQYSFATNIPSEYSPVSFTAQIPAQIVGIIDSPVDDPYWHGESFESTSQDPTYKPIVSIDTFLKALTLIAAQYGGSNVFMNGTLFSYYYLDVPNITIDHLDDLITRLNHAAIDVPFQDNLIENVVDTQISSPTMRSNGQPSSLERFRDRVAIIKIPLALLTILALALVLFFITLAAGILIERQAEVIALLRSRGAKRYQVFSAFTLQGLGLGLLALIVGPLLAILVVMLTVHLTFSPADQGALSAITDDPFQTVWGLRGYALAAGAAAGIAMLIAIWGAVRRDILAVRRESARSTSKPLWQRLELDVIAALFALAVFGVSTYATNSGAIDARTNQVIALPLSLIAPIFLLIAAVLLFLRLFALFLRFFSRRAARRPEAPPMLALAQVSRAPRQSQRMILLLALSIAYTVFTLVFSASQTQQIFNAAAQQVGADFSGPIPSNIGPGPSPAEQEAAYRKLPGVLSASLGYTIDGIPIGGAASLPLEIRAVNSATFAQTAIWTGQDSDQPLADLLKRISNPAQAREIGSQLAMPAIVDAITWNTLDLKAGQTFQVNLSGISTRSFTFIAAAEAQHIPTVNDSLETNGAADYQTPGGMLVDFTLYSRAVAQGALPPNYVWLRSSDDPATLAKLRSALTSGPLALLTVSDRRALMNFMGKDPLYLDINGMLMLEASATLLLVLIGTLLASWLTARNRLTNFAVLRALGSTPRQIASTLGWEQGIIYILGLALGACFGALLVFTLVPALVFTNPTRPGTAINSTEFYVIQHVLPVQIVLPGTLVIAFIVLIAICATALVMMARTVSQPSLSQTLRLNED